MPSTEENSEYFKVDIGKDDDSDDDKNGIEDTEDGGAIVKLDETEPLGESKFYANLAEKLPETELTEIGRVLCELIERDKRSREKRDEQYEEGVRRTGLGDDAPGGAEFMGASKVVHPMLTEACVDFAARSMKEIFPANGPAKAFIAGDPTDVDLERGERLADFLNYQCTVQIPEMRSELEQMCTQLPLGGGQYVKSSWQDRKKRPTVLFVAIDDIYLPYAASNFYTAERKTHVQYVTELEFQMRVDSGMYRDIEVMSTLMPETSKTEQATDKVEGRDPDAYNEDGLRTIYECFCMYEIDEKTGVAPYIISIDKSSHKVLSIYRNWDEDDEKMLELDWIVEFPFIPWRGAYPIGLGHMIGGLSAAATGALRALLDSALINNFPGLLKLKGGTSGGQTERIDPTQVMEVEGSLADDDVRKLVMPMPFSPPSPVLFELLGFLVDAGKQVIRTNMEEMADSSQDVPVGTTMARLEQGMMVYSAIHGRLHDAMGKLLKVLYRINKFYLEEEEVFEETGKLLVKRKDFQGPMTVVPVSDPNIFSESQRFAQIQLVAQRAQMLPQLYDLRKVEELILERMKIPNVDDLLLPKQEGQETNAVNENIAATMGRPIVAFPEQEHLSHLQVHLEFITNPMLGMSPMMAPQCLPVLLEHLKEHIVLWYAQKIFDVATEAAGVEINELQKKATRDERKAFDKMLAEASRHVNPMVQSQFQQIPGVVQQCQQLLQQMAPQPQDPAMQLGMAEIQSKEKIAGQQISAEQQKAAQAAQIENLKMQHAKELEMLKGQVKGQELSLKGQLEGTKLQDTREIEGAKLSEQSRQADQVLDMESMKQQQENLRTQAQLQNQIVIEQMKQGHAREIESLKAAHQGELAKRQQEHDMNSKVADHHMAKEQARDAHEQGKEVEGMKQQHAMGLEGMKQQSTHALEDKKQSHAGEIERMKQGGAVEQKKMDIASSHAMEADKREHEEKMQTRADTMQMYSEGGKIAHEKEMKGAEMAHTEKMTAKEHEHASKEGQKEREHGAQLEDKKATHDMAKTKHVEKNKADVADKQLKLKEKEGKEQLKIKQEESKFGMGIKEQESGIKQQIMAAEGEQKLQFKEQEGHLGLKAKEEKAKLDGQYAKEEHKGKLGLLKTKTKLTESQLKEKAKMASQEMKKPKPKSTKDKK